MNVRLSLAAIATAHAFSLPALAQSPAPDSKLVERGAYLAKGIAACGNCHFQRDKTGKPLFERGLSGGMVFDEEPFRAVASNITNGAGTGVGKWTDAQLIRAIREGIRPDGTVIGPSMPIGFYRGMADADVKAIVAYLRAMKPQKLGGA